MKYLLILTLLLTGCISIEKHLVIEGEGIKVPYGLTSIKGDKIKITRDFYMNVEKKDE